MALSWAGTAAGGVVGVFLLISPSPDVWSSEIAMCNAFPVFIASRVLGVHKAALS